jgi:hypothetical protein
MALWLVTDPPARVHALLRHLKLLLYGRSSWSTAPPGPVSRPRPSGTPPSRFFLAVVMLYLGMLRIVSGTRR